MNLEFIPLHDAPQYMDECITILNEEWPRSYNFRLLSLKKSSINFPVSLILVNKGQNLVLGHSKLCKLPKSSTDCWLESVIVRKADRGKGFGRILMQMTEKFAKDQHFSTIHLTTRDKKDFYQKLGYKICEDSPPVVNVGANAKLFEKFNFTCFNSTAWPSMSLNNRKILKRNETDAASSRNGIRLKDENYYRGFSTTAMKKDI
uniref:N-acetyltransferase domain-containing protein n=1 Tax=Romanomermis culicivorax TaxID=13658 RepID=A0A915L5I4_ROMCU